MITQNEMFYIPVDIDDEYTVLLGYIVDIQHLPAEYRPADMPGEGGITRLTLADGAIYDTEASVDSVTRKIWSAVGTYKRMS